MSRVRAVLLALALPACGLAAPAGSAASAPVAPFEARYEVRRNGDVLGEAHLRLSNDAEGWRFESRTTGTRGLARMLGLRIEESSHFVWNAEGRPETREYRYVQSTGVQRRERGVRVDPAADRIRLHDREHSAESPLMAGVVDRQLLTVALMQAVAECRRGDQVLPVAGRRRVEAQTWRIGAAAAVPGQPAGTQGVVIEMIRESPDGRSTRIWLDPYPPHAPLRIEQREDDGEFLEMRRLAG